MSKKKIIALVLACLMAASLAAPAFADVSGNQIELEGTYNPPRVAVVIGPTTGNNVYINPYGSPVAIVNTSDDNFYELTGQIVSTPLYIANLGTTKLQVGAQATVEVKGFELTTRPVDAKVTEKQANIILEVATFADKATSGASGASENTDSVKALTAQGASFGTNAKDLTLVAAADAKNWEDAKKLVFGEEAVTSDDMGVLAGNATPTQDMTDLDAVPFAEGAIGLFRLTGTCTTFPETDWAATDTFTATIVFSFKAVPDTTT